MGKAATQEFYKNLATYLNNLSISCLIAGLINPALKVEEKVGPVYSVAADLHEAAKYFTSPPGLLSIALIALSFFFRQFAKFAIFRIPD